MPSTRRPGHRGGAEFAASAGAADRAVAEFVRTSHGILTLAEGGKLGISARMIETRVRRGFLHRVHPGMYSVGHRPLTDEARWLAAVRACGPGALLSHKSAAALWGIRRTSSAVIDVTVPSRRGCALQGIRAHRSVVASEDRDEIRGIPVTSLPPTILDIASCLSTSALDYAIHQAERQRKLKPADLHEILARLKGRKGTAAVRAILDRPGHDLDARTRSR